MQRHALHDFLARRLESKPAVMHDMWQAGGQAWMGAVWNVMEFEHTANAAVRRQFNAPLDTMR